MEYPTEPFGLTLDAFRIHSFSDFSPWHRRPAVSKRRTTMRSIWLNGSCDGYGETSGRFLQASFWKLRRVFRRWFQWGIYPNIPSTVHRLQVSITARRCVTFNAPISCWEPYWMTWRMPRQCSPRTRISSFLACKDKIKSLEPEISYRSLNGTPTNRMHKVSHCPFSNRSFLHAWNARVPIAPWYFKFEIDLSWQFRQKNQ